MYKNGMNDNTIKCCWDVPYINESDMIRTDVQIIELCEWRGRCCDTSTLLYKEQCHNIIDCFCTS